MAYQIWQRSLLATSFYKIELLASAIDGCKLLALGRR